MELESTYALAGAGATAGGVLSFGVDYAKRSHALPGNAGRPFDPHALRRLSLPAATLGAAVGASALVLAGQLASPEDRTVLTDRAVAGTAAGLLTGMGVGAVTAFMHRGRFPVITPGGQLITRTDLLTNEIAAYAMATTPLGTLGGGLLGLHAAHTNEGRPDGQPS